MVMSQSPVSLQDWQQALDMQDACNLSGVVFSYARVMQHICDEAFINGYGTEWKNSHPIAVLYADKIADLTDARPVGVSASFTRAYDYTMAVIEHDRTMHDYEHYARVDHHCPQTL